jgi:nucleoside-diphosphate-sugar epimerase
MRILITRGASQSAQELARRLAGPSGDCYDVRLTDVAIGANAQSGGTAASFDFAVANLGHDASTRIMLEDRDAVILLPPEPQENQSPHHVIDMATRGVYNLLRAAVEAGASRVLCISTLALMEAYDPELMVSERWRPRPTTEPMLLGAFLTEAVCREFGREHKLSITVLRLGRLVADESTLKSRSAELRWGDLAHAVEVALAAQPRPWAVYHIQSNAPDARFTTQKAQQELGYLQRTADWPAA